MILRPKVPRKLLPLLYPKRYKGAYGGRGGSKSHFFAEQVVFKSLDGKRIVCIREVQNSIKDSVKLLVTDKIQEFELNEEFDVLESEIRGPKGSMIIFKGMQSYNAANIKSLEGYDIAWVEEAQTLSQHSLDMLRPTLRKPGSELWFSWNPRYKTDPVDKFFRKTPHPDSVSVEINWRDNPWFPDELRRDMEHDFKTDAEKAEHIWNGAYGSEEGAILAKWVRKAEREGRVTDEVVYDRDGAKIDISCDLGFRDTASFWFWQRKPNGFSLVGYDQDSGLDTEEWLPRIGDSISRFGSNSLGKIWLPHDARAKTFQSRHSVVEQFLEFYGKDHVDLVPMSKKSDQIEAARKIIDKCEFHKTLCERGLDGLNAWHYLWNEETNVFSREPEHDWASHPSDAFAYGCQVMQMYSPPVAKNEPIKGIMVGMPSITVDELQRLDRPTRRERI